VRRRILAIVVASGLLGSLSGQPAVGASDPAPGDTSARPVAEPGYVRLERVIDTRKLGFGRPQGLAWSPMARALVVVGASTPARTSAHLLTLFEEDHGALALTGGLDPAAIAFDPVHQQLVGIAPAVRQIVRIDAARGRPVVVQGVERATLDVAVGDPSGAAIDRTGEAWLLDAAGTRIVSADGSRVVNLATPGGPAVALAIHPVNGHFFVLSAAGRDLHELDATGEPISSRNLGAVGLHDPRGLVIAPSGDPTDDAANVSAYVADAGSSGPRPGAGAGVYELALRPTLQTSVAPSAAGDLVSTINTFQWSPASPDPSGLAFDPGADDLIVVDGEVDEVTGAGFNGANGWRTSRTGTLASTFDVSAFNSEAVGVAFDNATNTYFISNDSGKRVWVIDPGSDDEPGTSDDTRYSFLTNVAGFGSTDPEGLAFGNGDLFIADGLGKEVYRVDPGPDGIFQGTTASDDTISHFDVQSLGQPDPEGIDFEASTGHLWVVSNDSNTDLLEVTVNGASVQTVEVNFPVLHPGGLTVAPGTSGSGNNVFIADRGIDNNDDPTENDGKIFEVDVPNSPATPTGTLQLPTNPIRLIDTRIGIGLSGKFRGNVYRTFNVRSHASIPDTAFAITGNVTAIDPSSAGYVSVLPAAVSIPPISNLNFPKNDIRANNFISPLATNGTVAIVYKASSSSTTHLVFDVTGYFVPGSGQGQYVDLTPARVLDTRVGTGLNGLFSSGSPRTFNVWGVGGIPTSAIAVTGNLTVTGQNRGGYASLTTTPDGTPSTSTVNFPKSDTRANGIVIKLSPTGALAAVVGNGPGGKAHLIFDVTGYFVQGSGGAIFHQVEPARLMDTRINVGLSGPFVSTSARTINVSPEDPIPSGAVAVTGNLTATQQTNGGYVSVTRTPDDNPPTSTINFPAGDTRANGIVAPLSSGDLSCVYRSGTSTTPTAHLILDVTGYFAP
jgi:sugar lactone lactonase YvrE